LDKKSASEIILRQTFYLILLIIALAVSFAAIKALAVESATERQLAARTDAVSMLLISTSVALILAGLFVVSRFLADASWRSRDFYLSSSVLKFSDLLVLLSIFLALSGTVQLVTEHIADETRIIVASIIAQPAVYSVVMLVIYVIIRRRGADPFFELGLRTRRLLRQLKLGFAGFLFHWPVRIIFVALSLAICKLVGVNPVQNPVIDLYREEPIGWIKVALVVVPLLSAPVFEEIFFRALLYRIVRSYVNAPLTIIFTSLLFASVHTGLNQAVNIFALGLILGYLVEKTGSIVPSIFLHFLINFTSVAALLLGFN